MKYDPSRVRECDDCGAVSTLGELTPQKRLPDAPAVWACHKCVTALGSHAEIYQNTVARGRTPAALAWRERHEQMGAAKADS